MKKITLYLFTCLLFYSCKAQVPIIHSKKFNFDEYIDLSLDDNSYDTFALKEKGKKVKADFYNQLLNHMESTILFRENSKRIRIQCVSENIIVTETNVNNRYGKIKTYSLKDYNILAETQTFLGNPIGISKRYEVNGQITEIDSEKNYTYSIEELIEKVTKEYKIDINNPDINNIGFRRSFVTDNGIGKFCYVIMISDIQSSSFRQLTLDGKNGNLIEDNRGQYKKK